jgi:hypothetical protein
MSANPGRRVALVERAPQGTPVLRSATLEPLAARKILDLNVKTNVNLKQTAEIAASVRFRAESTICRSRRTMLALHEPNSRCGRRQVLSGSGRWPMAMLRSADPFFSRWVSPWRARQIQGFALRAILFCW